MNPSRHRLHITSFGLAKWKPRKSTIISTFSTRERGIIHRPTSKSSCTAEYLAKVTRTADLEQQHVLGRRMGAAPQTEEFTSQFYLLIDGWPWLLWASSRKDSLLSEILSLSTGGGLNETMFTRDNSALCIVFLHKWGSLETTLPRNDKKEILVQLEEGSPPHQAPKLLWGEKEAVQENGETGASNASSVKLKSHKGSMCHWTEWGDSGMRNEAALFSVHIWT